MLIRIKYDPDRLTAVPHPYDVPTFAMLGEDCVAKTVILDVPAEDFPPLEDRSHKPKCVDTHRGPVFTGAPDAFYESWHAHLDQRYQEHAGKFRPQLA